MFRAPEERMRPAGRLVGMFSVPPCGEILARNPMLEIQGEN
jgi:hypothetical protein